MPVLAEISADTLVIALASGAGGAVLGKWIEGRFQRDRDFRDWNFAAAADYTTGVHQALVALRNGYEALLEHGNDRADGHVEIRDPKTDAIRPEIDQPLREARRLVDDVVSSLGRIHILFGDSSPSGSAATATLINLRSASEALSDWPVPDVNVYKEAFAAAEEAHSEFNRAVLQTLRNPGVLERTRLPGRSRPSDED